MFEQGPSCAALFVFYQGTMSNPEFSIFTQFKDITALGVAALAFILTIRVILSNARERERIDVLRAQQVKDDASERQSELDREERWTTLLVNTMAGRFETSVQVMGDTVTRGMSDSMQLVSKSIDGHTQAIQRFQTAQTEAYGDFVKDFDRIAARITDHDTHAMQRYDEMKQEYVTTKAVIQTNTDSNTTLRNQLQQIQKEMQTLTIALRDVASDKTLKEHTISSQNKTLLSLNGDILKELQTGFSEMRGFFEQIIPGIPPTPPDDKPPKVVNFLADDTPDDAQEQAA